MPGKIVSYALKNAIDLIEEAEILYSTKKYARANLLGLLAVEEISKADLILHYHRGEINVNLKKDLENHPVKFGSKDKVYLMRRQRVALVTKADRNAHKYEQSRQDSMYVGVRNSKIVRPSEIRAGKAESTIKKAKENLYYQYLKHVHTTDPKYDVRLPKPPDYIKIAKGYEKVLNIKRKN